MKFRAFVICCGALPAALAAMPVARAQTAVPVPPYNIGDAVRSADEARRGAPAPRPAAVPVLPQLTEPQFTLKDNETLFVRHFQIDGPSLVDEALVSAILAPYEKRKLTIAQIYEAADKITTLYREQGYLVAKAYVPAQDARGGVLRIKLLPGEYGSITVKNASLVRDEFVQGLINQVRAGSLYVHKDALERAMLLTADLAGAGMPRVAIGPGLRPETSDFVFEVPQGRRFDGYILGDNYGSPYTGRDRLSGGVNLNSPLGVGDRLSAFGIISETGKLKNGRLAYSLPLGYDGVRGEVSVFRTTYVLGGAYADLGATGTADGVSGTLSYALRRQRDESIYLSANVTHKSLQDNFFGVSFAFRTIDLGTIAVTRDTIGGFFGLPLTTSSTFSVSGGNVDFPDPVQRAINIAGVDTEGSYARANLLFNATLAFNEKLSLTTFFRAQKDLSSRKNLDSSEQMSLTGYWGVRSYDEGLAGDSGYLVTPELKYALPTPFFAYRHAVGVFTDVGGVWLANPAYTTTQKRFTQLNDVGFGYYGTYEYMAGQYLLLRAQVAQTYGSDAGAQAYDKKTKVLVQIGSTF